MCGLRLLAGVFDFMPREKQTYRREPRAVGGGIESGDVGLSFTYTVNEHTFQRGNNSLKQFLLGLMKYSNLLRLWIGGFLLNGSQNHHN